MKEPVAISAKAIKKDFYLPHETSSKSLKSLFVNIGKKRSKESTTQHALRGVSFDIKQGEFFGILGRNGSGKSTLLKLLAGIYQPTSGSVETNGRLVPFIELGVGFNPELSGRENVYLNGALLGFSRKDIDTMYDDIVEFAELEKFMDQKLKNYSSGMQVRLAFSVATRAKADILLVDEVLAVGDADFQRKCYNFFKNLKKTKTTVIFVTHDMSAVREYCDKAILIENGHITHSGEANEVANEYLRLFMDNQSGLVISEPNRWGNGELTYGEIKYKTTKQHIELTFTIHNNTEKVFDRCVDFGLDFYVDQQLVGGTHYYQNHSEGLSFDPKQTKKISAVFPNTLGAKNFTVNMNIKTDNGLVVCEEITNAISFYNTQGVSPFFPIVTDAEFVIK